MSGALATPTGRLLAMASDDERIESARLAGEALAERLERATPLGGPYTYADSLGGIVTYWPERDPRRGVPDVQTSTNPVGGRKVEHIAGAGGRIGQSEAGAGPTLSAAAWWDRRPAAADPLFATEFPMLPGPDRRE